MKLHVATVPSGDPVFWVESSYDERDAPKAAGFLWHGGNCKPNCGACSVQLAKVWWTRRIEAARNLAEHADAGARAVLGGAPPPTYEAPVEIADANLNLAILSALIYENILQPGDLRGLQKKLKPSRDELLEDSDDGKVRSDDWMYTLNYRLANQLLKTPITRSQLARLSELHWPERPWTDRNGRPITLQDLIFPQWSGEEGEFNIKDLTGVELCTNLEVFSVASYMVEGAAEKQLKVLARKYAKKSTAKAKAKPAAKTRAKVKTAAKSKVKRR